MTVIKDNPVTKSLFLSIKLGNPRLKCARYGICEINPDDDGSFYGMASQIIDQRVRATVFTTKHAQLRFSFDRKSMTAKTDKTYFASGFFIVEVAKELPLVVTHRLGISPCQIETGMYPISSNKDVYKIVVDIKAITNTGQSDCGCSKQVTNRQVGILQTEH
jgi:hypothetical protein